MQSTCSSFWTAIGERPGEVVSPLSAREARRSLFSVAFAQPYAVAGTREHRKYLSQGIILIFFTIRVETDKYPLVVCCRSSNTCPARKKAAEFV